MFEFKTFKVFKYSSAKMLFGDNIIFISSSFRNLLSELFLALAKERKSDD